MMKLEKADPKRIESIENIVKMSKRAFDTDVNVGGLPEDLPPEYDSLEWHREMALEGHLFEALVGEDAVGAAVLFYNENERLLYVGRIFVDSRFHRQGYGIALMKCVETVYPGVRRISLDTPLWNSRTNAFYQKMGYAKTREDEEFAYYEKQM